MTTGAELKSKRYQVEDVLEAIELYFEKGWSLSLIHI